MHVAAMHSISGASSPTDLAIVAPASEPAIVAEPAVVAEHAIVAPDPSAAAPEPAALDSAQELAAAADDAHAASGTLVLLSTRVRVELMGDLQCQVESEQLVEQLMGGQSPTLSLSLQPCWRESMLQA